MRLERLLAIAKSLLERAVLEQDKDAQARLLDHLRVLRYYRIEELEHELALEKLNKKYRNRAS